MSARTQLAPGIYDIGGGEISIVAEEVCAHFGVPLTHANFKTVVHGCLQAVAEDAALREGLPIPVVLVPDAG